MKSIYRKLTFIALSHLQGRQFCMLYNLIMKINGGARRCSFRDGLYFLAEDELSLHFTRPSRYRYYADGIEKRLIELFMQYTGGAVDVSNGNVILDCGANIGEFSLYCQRLGAKVYAFEPDTIEYEALSHNLKEMGNMFPFALWFESTSLSFALENDSGDSTVVIGDADTTCIEIIARRLDSFEEIKSHPRIRLFKLEAEGFELEVLRGATGLLKRIEFIAADLGPERGPSNDTSLPDVVNFLQHEGFVVEYFFPGRSIVLFKNAALAQSY